LYALAIHSTRGRHREESSASLIVVVGGGRRKEVVGVGMMGRGSRMMTGEEQY